MSVTQETLKELFDYKDGNLIWKVNKGLAKAGDIAGETPDSTGYRKVMVNGITYRLHRLVWMWFNGDTTENIKFKDGDRTNTSIENLAVVTKEDLLRGRIKFKNSTSQFKGVYFNSKTNKFVAQVKHKNKTVYVGSFDDELQAHQAWLTVAHQLRSSESQEVK